MHVAGSKKVDVSYPHIKKCCNYTYDIHTYIFNLIFGFCEYIKIILSFQTIEFLIFVCEMPFSRGMSDIEPLLVSLIKLSEPLLASTSLCLIFYLVLEPKFLSSSNPYLYYLYYHKWRFQNITLL